MTDTDPAATTVRDWINDWDWLDPDWGRRVPEVWEEVRQQCPMAFTERYGRAWMPVTIDAVRHVAGDTENFSSAWISVAPPDAERTATPPITSDPPDHGDHRRLLVSAFLPRAVAPLEAELRTFARRLIADLPAANVDAAVDYAQHIPVRAICQLVGAPETDGDLFRDWIYRIFQLAPQDNSVRDAVNRELREYFNTMLDDRETNPADDLATLVVHAEIDGDPVSRELKLGYLELLIIAGIDTTWSSIRSGLWHFALNPDDRRRLAAAADHDPVWVTAVEEVLRFHSPVTMARKVVADTTVADCPVRAGDQMLLTFPAANRDPAALPDADQFIIDRQANRHVAFGAGIHRCLGSNLARLEVTVAIREWLRAFPDYELDRSRPTTWANGQVRGPRTIPVILDPRS